MEEDLNNDFIEMSSYESDLSMSEQVTDETRDFLEFIQALKDDNITHLEELSKDTDKFTKCNS
jgi:hypothetical protein